jgi:hypothetical protein
MIWHITRRRRGLSIASFQLPSGAKERKILVSNQQEGEVFIAIDLEDNLDPISFFRDKADTIMALTESEICNN